uniref:Uncharacterized protein n=1 Tax=Kalanchoe fedtschenkoi TaxID=63787 RepID=A0A7N0T7I5_KALFE
MKQNTTRNRYGVALSSIPIRLSWSRYVLNLIIDMGDKDLWLRACFDCVLGNWDALPNWSFGRSSNRPKRCRQRQPRPLQRGARCFYYVHVKIWHV